MAKDNKIKLRGLLNEAFGTWGVVTHAHPNRKRLQEQEPGVPGAAPARPAPQPARTQPKPPMPTKPQQRPAVNDVPEEPKQTPPPTENLNFKVQPGFKVEFNGKPGQYYIIRIMNTSMTNFLVVNDKIGKPVQFIGVSVEKINSDEKGKPFNKK
jgi:hypothetical protein